MRACGRSLRLADGKPPRGQNIVEQAARRLRVIDPLDERGARGRPYIAQARRGARQETRYPLLAAERRRVWILPDYHGGIHDENGRAEADSLRANELLAFGLQPFSIWRSQYESTSYMDGLIDGIIRPRLGLGAHRPRLERRSLELARREALLSELDAIDGLSWGVSERAPRVIKAQEDVEEAKERLAWAERHLKRSSR